MKANLLSCLIFLSWATTLPAAEPIRFEKEERIVLLGATLIEREQRYGYWETVLTAMYPDKNLKFRNFGWSGDTVWGESRAGFGSQQDGYKKLVEITLEWKPTTIIICYGFNESFEGEKGLKKFEDGYKHLLNSLASLKAKIALLDPLPVSGEHAKVINENLALYSKSIEKLAKERGCAFVQLGVKQEPSPKHVNQLMERDQIEWNKEGYANLAEKLAVAFGNNATINWQDWEDLRKAIVAKNELVFYRWRPQNETYLFGFRKHEQGKNAKEVFEFDPLIDAAEKKIAELKKK